jgi:hypothetical protein
VWIEILLALVGLLGIGSLLRALVLQWLARRAAKADRAYAEKCDAYPEFLDAWKARGERPEEYARSRSRIELLGSAKVLQASLRSAAVRLSGNVRSLTVDPGM